MKTKLIIPILIAFLLFSLSIQSQELRKESFELLNLEQKGLEKVKKSYSEGNITQAAENLLDYFKTRKNVKHPEVNLNRVRISDEEQKWADDGLKHVFFVHKGYQPSYFYGDDINWQYWPVQDNELRWQLHRHKWFTPMGKAYHLTGDEKYAKEWVFQYMDWIKKNPLLVVERKDRPNLNDEQRKELENVRFAWRPLEVSNRLQDQTDQFMYFIASKYFTPEFLTEFLVNYHKHAEHILQNYSDKGNHLLFEAQRMITGGAFFPEFKDAEKWRKSGIDILNDEIKVQVFEDGFQFELDPHYHLAAINIFYKAIQIADANGFRNEFPKSYLDTVEKMIMAVINYLHPNYQNPMFSDAKLDSKKEMINNFKKWQPVFPNNPYIEYWATDGESGKLPSYLSNYLPTSGFFFFRNGWKENATFMVLKAGPPAFWHNQPDNGTFELSINGRNFFPDAGSYVYGGDSEVEKERNWFRQTSVHKTLTLDNKDIETTDSKCLLWDIKNKKQQVLVVENQGYANLKHRRTVFFVDEKFFVIVDEAAGAGTGKVGVHYQLSEGEMLLDPAKLTLKSDYKDGNNIFIQGFSNQPLKMTEEEGWVSYAYRQKKKRTAFAYETTKNNDKPVKFITVIYPVSTETPKVTAKFTDSNNKSTSVQVKVDKKKYDLKADW